MKNICIIYPNKTSSSESFIHTHISELPCNVFKLYGGWFPTLRDNDIPLIQNSGVEKFSLVKRGLTKLKLRNSYSYRHQQEEAFLKFLQDNKIDAVLAEYGLTGVAVMDACEKANVPLIVHFHGFDAYVKKVLEENRDAYRRLFEKASAIIAVSQHMKAQLQLLGAPANKLYYNVYGVDTNKFSPADSPVKKPVFLYSGRFVNKKAPQLVITCFAEVLKQMPEARMVMIGDGGLGSNGELYEACRQMVRAYGIENSVEFIGALPNEEVAVYMRSVSIFIQHSVTADTGDSEGTPVSMLEALASGLPVIGTMHAGIKDVISHGVNGFLVEEFDIHKTVQYMLELGENFTLVKEMGAKAREEVLKNYNQHTTVGKLYNIIENAISNYKMNNNEDIN